MDTIHISIATVCPLLRLAVNDLDLQQVSSIYRQIVLHTNNLLLEAEDTTATWNIIIENLIPSDMRQLVEAQLQESKINEAFARYQEIAYKQRSMDNRRASRQGSVLRQWKHSNFFDFAIDRGWFDRKPNEFWRWLRTLSIRFEKWENVAQLLRCMFFNVNLDGCAWERIANCDKIDHIPNKFLERLASDRSSAWNREWLDPLEHDFLIRRYSLEFDEFGFVDPSRCAHAIVEATRRERGRLETSTTRIGWTLSEAAVAEYKMGQKHNSARFDDNISAMPNPNQASSDCPTEGRMRPGLATARLEPVHGKRSAAVAHEGALRKRKRHSGFRGSDNSDSPDMTSRGQKEGRQEAGNARETYTTNTEQDTESSTESNTSEHIRYDLEAPVSQCGSDESDPRPLNDRRSRKTHQLLKSSLDFVEKWIQEATGREECKQHVDRLNSAVPLLSPDGYKIAREWHFRGSLTRDVLQCNDDLRDHADVWCLSMSQASDLMALKMPLPKPLVIRPTEHTFSLDNFLANMQHTYTLEGQVSVQGGTDQAPQELNSRMTLCEVLKRLKSNMDIQDPLSLKPLNCLDLSTLPQYVGIPAFIQDPRFSVVTTMQSWEERKAGRIMTPGKQTFPTEANMTGILPTPVDIQHCGTFTLLASALAFSWWHEDLLNNTWIQCLSGTKAWYVRVNDSKGVPPMLLLEPGTYLFMPAGLKVEHAVFTLEGPSVAVGGQHIDGCALMQQLEIMRQLIDDPDRTNESVPPLQLPPLLDAIIVYLEGHSQIDGIFGPMFDNRSLAQRVRSFKTKARRDFGCNCANRGQECIKDRCPCMTKKVGNVMRRRCTSWCSGKVHRYTREVADSSCFAEVSD